MKYIPKYQRAGKLPTLPNYANVQSAQDNVVRQYNPVTNPDERYTSEEEARKLRVAQREKELQEYYSQPGMVSGMKRKPTPSEVKAHAESSVTYNDRVKNDPVGTFGPDLALSFIPELLMFKGPQQIISRGLNRMNPFKNYNPWNKMPAFKPNPEAYYRVIGDEVGYNDLINSGVIRPNQTGPFKGRSTYYTKGAINDINNPVVGGNVAKGTTYKGDYIVEVLPNEKHFPLDNHKLHKDWNFGITKKGNEIPYSSEFVNVYKRGKKGYESVPKKQFQSEIDWAKWNPDTPKYPELINEYNTIEESAKKAGTWMKNPDGSPFTGSQLTKEAIIAHPKLSNNITNEEIAKMQFLQQQSSWFKKSFQNPVVDDIGNIQINYHGQREGKPFNIFKPSQRGSHGVGNYTFPGNRKAALRYANNNEGRVYELYINSNNPQKRLESVFSPEFDEVTGRLQPGYDFLRVGNEQVTPESNYLKSALGNVGFFDMTNPNIYKALLPVGLGTAAYSKVNKNQKGGVINSTPVFLGNIPFVSNKQSAINRSKEILKEQEELAKSISVRNPVYKSQQEADSELNSTAYNWVTGDRQTYNSFLPGVTIKASNTPVGYRGDMKSMREDLLNTSPLIHSQVPRKYDKYKIADRVSNEAPAANPSNQGLINAAKFVATESPLAVSPLPFVDNAIRGFKYLNGRLTNHIISKVENPKYLETVWNRINNTAKFKTDPIWYTLQTPHRLVNKGLNKRIAHLESIPNFTENTVKKLKVLENIKDGLDKVYDVGINHSWINTHNPLGEGGYSIAYPSMRGNKVIKFGRVPDFETAETLQHMVNIGKTNKNPRLALPYIIQKVGKENSTDIYGFVMNKVPGTKMEKGFMPKLENIKQLGKELGDLTDKGIYLDYANPDNVLYDEITGKLSALDFNTLPPEGSWFLRNNAIDQTPLESLEDRFFGIPKKSIWPSP